MRSLVVALVACLVTVSPVVAQAPPAKSVEDARAAFASGDYQGCLRKISPLLSSAKRDSPERYDLLMLRGECLLRLKQRNAAMPAFEAAAAVMKGRRDLERTAAATALAVLVRESPDLTYKSKANPGRGGVDVVDPATRKVAMAALFEDLKSRLAPEVEKALKDKSLVTTHKRLKDFWELYAVELAATGSADSTAGTLQEVGGHARGLIADELDRITTRLDQLGDLASDPAWTNAGISHRGLSTNERAELKQTADYLVQIQRTVENGRRIAQALGRTGENWETLLADCAEARDAAQEAYDRRY